MTAMERNESMNAYFNGYVNSITMLNEFVVQYDKAVHTRREVEKREDFHTMNTQASLSGTHPMRKWSGHDTQDESLRSFR